MGSVQMFVDKPRGLLTGDMVTFRPDPAVVIYVGGEEFPIPHDHIDLNRGIIRIPEYLRLRFPGQTYTLSVNTVVLSKRDEEREREAKKDPRQNYLKLRKTRF